MLAYYIHNSSRKKAEIPDDPGECVESPGEGFKVLMGPARGYELADIYRLRRLSSVLEPASSS